MYERTLIEAGAPPQDVQYRFGFLKRRTIAAMISQSPEFRALVEDALKKAREKYPKNSRAFNFFEAYYGLNGRERQTFKQIGQSFGSVKDPKVAITTMPVERHLHEGEMLVHHELRESANK